MGLDMYLYKVTYVGANQDHRDIQGTIDLTEPIWKDGTKLGRRKIDIDLKKVSLKDLALAESNGDNFCIEGDEFYEEVYSKMKESIDNIYNQTKGQT